MVSGRPGILVIIFANVLDSDKTPVLKTFQCAFLEIKYFIAVNAIKVGVKIPGFIGCIQGKATVKFRYGASKAHLITCIYSTIAIHVSKITVAWLSPYLLVSRKAFSFGIGI